MSDRVLTHLDPLGRARMVDVTPKEPTYRRATARCTVTMEPETVNKVASNAMTKATSWPSPGWRGSRPPSRRPR